MALLQYVFFTKIIPVRGNNAEKIKKLLAKVKMKK